MNQAAYTPETPIFGHPLDVFPSLRRIPQSLARDLVYTLLLSAVTTLTFSLIAILNSPTASFKELLMFNAVFSLCTGYSIHLLSVLVGRSLAHWFPEISTTLRTALVICTAVLAGAFGYWLGSQILGLNFRFWSGMMVVSAWVGAVLTGIAITQRRLTLSQLAFERERTARVEAERLVIVARLQMLQAQIEPHFLFNTLANVSSLIEVEPKRARKMLDEFTLLLRAALDSTRSSTTTLNKELQVVEAYLGVLKVRMGERLSYRIDAAPELLTLNVPAMLLQPIVENAVKHGIEPRVAGGSVVITVQHEKEQLVFTVADDGVGFMPNRQENVGLGAVRERLAVQFGAAAQLNIERTPESWTRVAIRLPFPNGVEKA